MESIITLAALISIIFFIIKFLEIKFLNKENKPIKELVVDTIIVFVSCILSLVLSEQFSILKDIPFISKNNPISNNQLQAFSSSPDF